MRGAHKRTRRGWAAPIGLAAGVAVTISGCGVAAGGSTVDIDYWLWDANQLLPYQQCLDAFEEENPDVRVRVSQYGFDDYWLKLTAGSCDAVLHERHHQKDQQQCHAQRRGIAEVELAEGIVIDVKLEDPAGIDRPAVGGHGNGVEDLE